MTGLKRKILKSGTLITGGTMVSRMLGFVREILAAAYFGGGRLYDAFVVAFTIPALFRRILGEEMFERAFMPPFERLRSSGQEGNARRFLFRLLVALSLILVALTTVLFFFMEPLVGMLAPGLDPATSETAVILGRQILPFLVLISFSTFAGAILLFSDRNLLYSLAPAAMNVGIIVVLVLFHQSLGIGAMVLACIAGSAVFLLVQLPAVFQIVRRIPKTETDPGGSAIGGSMREGRRIFISAVANKGTEVVDKIVASLVGAGAISSLWYAFRVIHLPFAILGLAISRAIAPELSRLRGSRNYRDFGHVIHFGIDLNLFLLVPVTVFFLFFDQEIIALFYYRGAFTMDAVHRTSLAFLFYSLSLAPMGLVVLMGRIFSAFENNRAPMMAAIAAAVLHVVLDFILYRTPLKQGGIALATAISQSTQAILLFWALRHYPVRLRPARLLGSVSQLGFALIFFVAILITAKWIMPVTVSFVPLLLGLGTTGALAFGLYGLVVYGFLRTRGGRKCRVVLTGGGTGGHVYPALAIYRTLLERNMVSEVRYYGVKGRAEDEIVPRYNIPLIHVPSAPIAGGSRLRQLSGGLTILKGTIIALGRMIRYKPHLVVAAGGYVAAPVVFAAFILKPFLKLKIVINEQNLVPGLLNKVASLMADVVLVNFRESAYFMWSNRCVYTGYPVRDDYLKTSPDPGALRKDLGIPDDAFLVVVAGGSMGARAINRSLSQALPRLAESEKLYIVHSTGLSRTATYDAWSDTADRIALHMQERFDRETGTAIRPDGTVWYEAHPYLHNLFDYQRAADLLVCRAGAGSLAEGLALAKPLLLIPKRGLPGDHQELNAISIAEQKAADVIFEQHDPDSHTDRIDPDELANAILRWKEQATERETMGKAAGRLFLKDTPERIARTIEMTLAGEEIEPDTSIVEPRFVRFQRTFDNLINFLDHNASQSRDNLYFRFYGIKVDEYLSARSMLTVNKGIKLIGSLKRTDLYPYLIDHFDRFAGFQKRNALAALAKADHYDDRFDDVIRSGLNDGYFETRREAVNLYTRFHAKLTEQTDMHDRIICLLNRPVESFEVRIAAIRAAVRFLDQDAFLNQMNRFLFSRNIRYREALLEAVQDGLALGRFTDRGALRQFLKRMLITTSQFQPTFTVRQRFVHTIKKLEEEADDQTPG